MLDLLEKEETVVHPVKKDEQVEKDNIEVLSNNPFPGIPGWVWLGVALGIIAMFAWFKKPVIVNETPVVVTSPEELIRDFAKSLPRESASDTGQYVLISEQASYLSAHYYAVTSLRCPSCEIIQSHLLSTTLPLISSRNWKELIVGKTKLVLDPSFPTDAFVEVIPLSNLTDGEYGLMTILMYIKIAHPELISRTTVIYSFSPDIKAFCISNGFKVNSLGG